MSNTNFFAEFFQAQDIQLSYCCAGCWSFLNIYHADEHGYRVTCDRCGDDRGFVRKTWAEHRLSDNAGEAIEVRALLRKLKVLPESNRTADEVFKELGF